MLPPHEIILTPKASRPIPPPDNTPVKDSIESWLLDESWNTYLTRSPTLPAYTHPDQALFDKTVKRALTAYLATSNTTSGCFDRCHISLTLSKGPRTSRGVVVIDVPMAAPAAWATIGGLSHVIEEGSPQWGNRNRRYKPALLEATVVRASAVFVKEMREICDPLLIRIQFEEAD